MDDVLLKKLEALLAGQEEMCKGIAELLERSPRSAVAAAASAPAVDIDGEWGDPEIRRDPPKWDGESFKGKRYSQCPPAYLRKLAGFFEWGANKTEKEGDPARQKYVAYDRRDAAKARAWADRLERNPPAPRNEEIPF